MHPSNSATVARPQSARRAPVICLTVLHDDIYEDVALERGAVDFVDKSRRWNRRCLRRELRAAASGQRRVCEEMLSFRSRPVSGDQSERGEALYRARLFRSTIALSPAKISTGAGG